MIFSLNKLESDKIHNLIETNYYNDEVSDFINEYMIGAIEPIENDIVSIDKLNINEFISNEYYKTVLPNLSNLNHYCLKYESYKETEIFLYDDIEVFDDDYFLINYKLGYFDRPYKFLSLSYKDKTWMSIIPHEINTISKSKNKNKRIFIFGLGLGYFPFINVDNYEEIIIVDNSIDVINIFKNNIFPFFKNKEKYKFINDDAFNVIKQIKENDDVFVDLYHDAIDGLKIYYDFKNAIKNLNCNVTYWIEKSLLASFRHIFINLIEEEVYHKGEFDYKKESNFIDKLINKLHFYFIDYQINNYEQIKNLLTDKSLKELICKI